MTGTEELRSEKSQSKDFLKRFFPLFIRGGQVCRSLICYPMHVRYTPCIQQLPYVYYGFSARLFTRVCPSFFTGDQCRKRSESSHDVCCRLVAARVAQSPGRHYRMRLHLGWWTPALHEANDIVLFQTMDKSSDHNQRPCDHQQCLELIAHRR